MENGPEWTEMDQNGPEWTEMDRNGPKWTVLNDCPLSISVHFLLFRRNFLKNKLNYDTMVP